MPAKIRPIIATALGRGELNGEHRLADGTSRPLTDDIQASQEQAEDQRAATPC